MGLTVVLMISRSVSSPCGYFILSEYVHSNRNLELTNHIHWTSKLSNIFKRQTHSYFKFQMQLPVQNICKIAMMLLGKGWQIKKIRQAAENIWLLLFLWEKSRIRKQKYTMYNLKNDLIVFLLWTFLLSI